MSAMAMVAKARNLERRRRFGTVMLVSCLGFSFGVVPIGILVCLFVMVDVGGEVSDPLRAKPLRHSWTLRFQYRPTLWAVMCDCSTRNLAGNPDSPQAVIFLTSIIDVIRGY